MVPCSRVRTSLVALAFALSALPALSQTGDECSSPIVVGTGTFVADLSLNTGSTGDDSSMCASDDTIDRWYLYIAPSAGTLTVSTCNPGTEFDTVLSAYSTCGGPDIACNDDSAVVLQACSLNGLNRKSIMTVPVSAGQSVLVRLSAFRDLIGSGQAQITFAGPPEPPGYDCQGPIEVGDGTFIGDLGDNVGIGPDDSSCGGIVGVADTYDEWYAYTARADGTASVSTCMPGTQFDTVISVWDACPLAGGVELACNDDASGPGNCDLGGLNRKSYVTFPIREKRTYYVRVSVYDDDFSCPVCTGTQYEIRFAGPSVSSADECNIGLNVGEGTYLRSLDLNTGATGDDSSCATNDTIDEWFDYTATADGLARITTCNPGTEFDTVLSIFDGCAGAEIACNDDTPGAPAECSLSGLNRKSTIELSVTDGTSYQIRVSVFGDNFTTALGMNYELSITLLCPCDWSDDGSLNDQDFFDWVNDYFTQTGPQGQFDYNQDGNENDQDWFDFVNCYFTPPAGCLP